MALRAFTSRIIPGLYRSSATMEGFIGRSSRYFSDEKGRILSEEERAKEAVYIKKMERERLEKLRRKLEKDKAAETGDKKSEEPKKAG